MLFTVVIPVFNSSDYILDTLKSVQVASRSSDYEIILIDDCSKDVDKLKKILQDFDEVKLIEKDEKTNAANSRNIGILKSKGRYVFLLDSDDHFVPDSIDRRICLHEENKAGVIFGNFITKIGRKQKKSELPEYHFEDMRDYILIKKGDFRSSVISVDKQYYNNTLFDDLSQKHQDWIFAFRCWDNEEKIKFDQQYSTIINVDRTSRMSSSMNVKASKYLCQEYLKNREHINGFSENHWNAMVNYNDRQACIFFISIYEPRTISEHLEFGFYKLIASKPILPLSSRAVITLKHLRDK
ncbi:glycosyltransferase family 2 protein [Psychrobacter pacificensis]|uniref:glycosyltransferase family 2 protein n=1 Tax=Psychrobacter pacificensis TaxID=112002 RepID=UPI003D0238A2